MLINQGNIRNMITRYSSGTNSGWFIDSGSMSILLLHDFKAMRRIADLLFSQIWPNH